MDLLGKGRTRITAFLTEVVIYLLAASFRIGVNLHIYEALFFRTKDGKKTMRGDALKRFGIIEIYLVLLSLRTGGLLCGLGHDAAGLEYLTEGFAHRGSLAQTLCNDVTGTCKGVLHGLDLVTDKGPGLLERIIYGNRIHLVRQRFQSEFLGSGSSGAPLGLIWKIQILQLSGFHAVLDL